MATVRTAKTPPSFVRFGEVTIVLHLLSVLARPLVALTISGRSRETETHAGGATRTQVHSVGPDSDRILLVVDSADVADGPLTQELGLADQLARQLTQATARGTDIDVLAMRSMGIGNCLTAMAALDLARFDALVLLIGTSEALTLRPVTRWAIQLDELLGYIADHSHPELHSFVVEIPPARELTDLPPVLITIIETHTARLNAVTARRCATRGRVTMIPFGAPSSVGSERSSDAAVVAWARFISPSVGALLEAVSGRPHGPESSAADDVRGGSD